MKGKNEEREGMEGRKERTNKRLFFSHGNNSNSKDKNKNTATYIESGREREDLGLDTGNSDDETHSYR